MRYLKDIPHNRYKIGLYQWNGKYIVKVETEGTYEQTYKLDETDFSTVEEVENLFDESFLKSIDTRFRQMHDDTLQSLTRHGIYF